MSRKEMPRAGLVKAALAGQVTDAQAAVALHMTVRQFQRLKRRFRDGGPRALLHGLRGRPANHQLPTELRAQIATLLTTTYAGFNDIHLTEKLTEVHGLHVSRVSVRRIRRGLGLAAIRRRRPAKHRSRRLREAASGCLMQVDGSPFDWLESRGPLMTLQGGLDDATSTIVGLTFRPHEDLHGYAVVFQQTFAHHGVPLAVYGDGINILIRNDPHWTLAEQLAGEQAPTHLGRVFRELGIRYIQAHSPQAKGRVERLWETLQDRLVSELRLRGISTLEDANAFLPAFIRDYNRRFACPPAAVAGAWRPPPPDIDLILSCRYHRVVARDNTVRLGARWIQIPRPRGGRSFAGSRVELRELLDGRLMVFYDGAVIASQPSPSADFVLRPRSQPRADRPRRQPRHVVRGTTAATTLASPAPRATRPSTRHPWRHAFKRETRLLHPVPG